ncbi:MAG TPA: DUF6175 family protein [Saprospiraceae bacterium]|nr:DUF6175 family protein [Saprospiraceae bacterium]
MKTICTLVPGCYLMTFSILVSAQTEVTTAPEAKTLQPTIMVIPFTREGQSLRSKYESDELVRVAITKVKEGFDTRGVNTIDLRAKLKQTSNNEVLQEDQKSDMKDEVIALSGADIYVEVEANKNLSSSGNSVTLIMTSFDAFSGESYSNKVANSPKFYTDNYEKLIMNAVESEIDNFLNTINEKFADLRENGRTVVLSVGILEGSVHDFDSEVGSSGALLSDAIEDWVLENAFKNYYHIQGTTSNKIIFDIVKVPLKDARGNNYRISSFAATLRSYLDSLGLKSERTINGNNVTITIL